MNRKSKDIGKTIIIDGSQGEGGGQVLRSALSLAILTQQAIEIKNIRANRKKSGLLRQHLTAVLAAKEICNAETEGVELGASHIRFVPSEIQAGNYHFAIGTAGSTALVCQTILPVLALTNAPSTVTFEGGTHNGMCPSLCFLQQSYFPILKRMGVDCQVSISRLGFYPAGGGKWTLSITPTDKFKPLDLMGSFDLLDPSTNIKTSMKALVSKLPENIGEREIKAAQKTLRWEEASNTVESVDSLGPGNIFHIAMKGASHTNVFEVVGEFGVTAERIGKRCAGRVKAFLSANVAVEEHLADQLLLPFALAGQGRFTTTQPTLHTLTNIGIIHQVLGVRFYVKQLNQKQWEIGVET